ncbi:MAG: hypothetical protein H6865_07765 [Rhodospirillales bacterium]|nr:hypothetical protein [Rhodospirillales bacterium]USO07515.1 MAG: hypothetical protein H6866_08890 [Rhodospirillales bacterium]
MKINVTCGLHGTRRTACPSLQNVVPSTVFDIDATRIASYGGGGGKWSNLVAAPADGAAQGAYDFYLGVDGAASTDDPAFNGTPGAPSAYWSFDGGDLFSLKSGVNTSFLNALHKTTGGTPWWLAVAYRPIDAASSDALFATQGTSSSSIGINLLQGSTERIALIQRGDTNLVATSSTAFPAIVPGTDTLVIFSYSAGACRCWINTRTKIETTITPNASASNAANPAQIGARGAGLYLENGTRIYAVSMGNAFIDDAQAVKLINAYNLRHARIYA